MAVDLGIGRPTTSKLVVEIYREILRGSHSEQSAFDAAVRLYRQRHQGVPEPAARRLVAEIICRQP
jgi:hypothetical protein